MNYRNDYPVISVFISDVHHLSKENFSSSDAVIADTVLSVSAYDRISAKTREESLDFAHELIKYFTSHLLLHHFQDEVPLFTIFLGIDEEHASINTHGGYYANFIKSIPSLQNHLDDLMLSVREDLDINRHNIENIVMELSDMPRVDIKSIPANDATDLGEFAEDLFWSYNRVIRTPYSELYALYLNDESAGEIHLHIGKTIDATIITTLEITEKEKAELMGYIHETILESLEEEYDTSSTITFYSDAEEYV